MLARLTIAKKLTLGFAVIILIICVLIGLVRKGLGQIDDATQWNIHTYEVLGTSSSLLISLTNIETGMRGFALSGQEDFLAPLIAGRADFDQAWKRLRELTSDNPTQQARLQEIQDTERKWLADDIDGTLALRRDVLGGKGTMNDVVGRISARQDKAKMDGMRKLIADFQGDEQRLLGVRTKALADAASMANTSMLMGGLIAAGVALLIAITLSASIRVRLNLAIEAARKIAAGRLDSRLENAGTDEIGQLLAAFSQMQERLREMIAEIKQGAGQLLHSAKEISATSEALASSAQDQSNSASSMAATVEQLTVSISHVAASASEAHGVASDSGQHSVEGGAVIQNTLRSMSLIAATIQSSAAQVSDLGRHIQQITSIVNVISEIAEQTNLLALNAAIEAARAGEQGRGFAVVADEVRLLAQRTGKSTSEISDMIQTIQARALEAVSQMGVGVEQANQGLELANSAQIAIEQIQGGSSRIITVVDQISLALNEQNAASQDVARTVEHIAQMAQSSSEGVTGASRNAATIEKLAKVLDAQVSQFSL